MKTSTFLGLLAVASPALAFPALQVERLAEAVKRDDNLLPRVLQYKQERRRIKPKFDAATQHVETTGDHAWKAPGPNDQRGPCPGLNALANHGYLPHNGVAELTTIISATNAVYGMALDLATFLAVYGTVFDGNILSLNPGYSIGGPAKGAEQILGNGAGLLGAPTGLSGSHNKYEADTSPTRGDLYLSGNDYILQVNQFQQYYDALPKGPMSAYDQYDALFDFRISRYNHSLKHNPYFFFSPFAGILVAPAGYSFPPAMMSNKSAEFPEGYLSRETLKSFFGITGSRGKFKYTVGHERIPHNFYKRAIGDEYTIPGFLADVLDFAIRDPRLLNIGGNTGKPNSFFGLDLGNLTGGVFSSASLLKGNNLECFLYQIVTAAGPDILNGQYRTPSAAMKPLLAQLTNIFGNLGCPKLAKINQEQYKIFPGAVRSQGAM